MNNRTSKVGVDIFIAFLSLCLPWSRFVAIVSWNGGNVYFLLHLIFSFFRSLCNTIVSNRSWPIPGGLGHDNKKLFLTGDTLDCPRNNYTKGVITRKEMLVADVVTNVFTILSEQRAMRENGWALHFNWCPENVATASDTLFVSSMCNVQMCCSKQNALLNFCLSCGK